MIYDKNVRAWVSMVSYLKIFQEEKKILVAV
jgi:hypothetical protein